MALSSTTKLMVSKARVTHPAMVMGTTRPITQVFTPLHDTTDPGSYHCMHQLATSCTWKTCPPSHTDICVFVDNVIPQSVAMTMMYNQQYTAAAQNYNQVRCLSLLGVEYNQSVIWTEDMCPVMC